MCGNLTWCPLRECLLVIVILLRQPDLVPITRVPTSTSTIVLSSLTWCQLRECPLVIVLLLRQPDLVPITRVPTSEAT